MGKALGQMVSQAEMTFDNGVSHLDALRPDELSEPLSLFVGIMSGRSRTDECLVGRHLGWGVAVSLALLFGHLVRSPPTVLQAWLKELVAINHPIG